MQLNQVLDSFFNKGFKASKCKTLLKLTTARMKLLRNKRDIQIRQMRKELSQLLQSGQETSARIRVEHIVREQNIVAAYEILELFCELIVVRLPIIESQRECPIDLREAVSSLIFAAPRCDDLQELLEVRNLFAAKYGKEFVAAATELLPECGVNRQIIEKLSVRAPSGKVKLKLLKEIAEENNVDWDASATEAELLKTPEDLLEGLNQFQSATQMSIEVNSEDESHFSPVEFSKVVSSQTPLHSQEEHSSSLSPQSQPEDSPVEKQFVPFVVPASEQSAKSTHFLSPPQSNFFSGKKGSASLSQQSQPEDSPVEKQFVPFVVPASEQVAKSTHFLSPPQANIFSGKKGSSTQSLQKSHARAKSEGSMDFQDVAEAAQAAAVAADMAAQAARAAEKLARSKVLWEKFHHNEGSSESNEDVYRTMHSEPSFREHLINETPRDDAHGLSKRPNINADHQGIQGSENSDKSVPYDIFDINSEKLQDKKGQVTEGDYGRDTSSKFDSYGNENSYDNLAGHQGLLQSPMKGESGHTDVPIFLSTISVPPPPGHPDRPLSPKTRKQGQPLYDSPMFDESSSLKSSWQPQRLNSFDDDSYFSYPNLFSDPSMSRTHSVYTDEHHKGGLPSSSLAPSANFMDPDDDFDNLTARFKVLQSEG